MTHCYPMPWEQYFAMHANVFGLTLAKLEVARHNYLNNTEEHAKVESGKEGMMGVFFQ